MKIIDYFKSFSPVGKPVFTPDCKEMSDPLPTDLWIEITSKCPYNCKFCSRKMLHGPGSHMPLDLFKSIIGQLKNPRVIRLNYSGESVCHPNLCEAIGLAASTGATTELVSAFSVFPKERMEEFVKNGLDRLTISLHTTDNAQYGEIYGLGDLDALTQRLDILRAKQKALQVSRPQLDFAFVAMKENLNQLRKVAAYAGSFGGIKLDIHPVIRRDEIPLHFDSELLNGRLKPSFIKALNKKIQSAREEYPALPMNVSTSELSAKEELEENPIPFPWPLPDGALISGCAQDPWSTAHILSNGDVGSCEIRDGIPLGNLAVDSLAEVWNGKPYREFRKGHILGKNHECANCVYKTAYRPGGLKKHIRPGGDNSRQLLKGWCNGDEPHIWSMPESLAVLPLWNKNSLYFSGLLPQGPPGKPNELTIHCNGELIAKYENRADVFITIHDRLKITGTPGPGYFRFRVKTPYRPSDHMKSDDGRLLGFALLELKIKCSII